MIENQPIPSDTRPPMTDNQPIMCDSLGGAPLVYSNEERQGFHYAPGEFEVRVTGAALRRVFGLARRLRLVAPDGWTVVDPERFVLDPSRTLCWHVRPAGEPASCLTNLVLEIARPDGGQTEIVHALPVEIRGRSQFDPRRHALPFANAAAELGEVAPEPAIFAETYRPSPLSTAFFQGLYSDVVYVSGDARRPRPGGLCTGIARSALEHSLTQPQERIADRDADDLRHAAQLWHGRQLADRALLASTAEWVRHGSRDAYRSFRQAVLTRGESALAMDVNVPRPWRRDLPSALVGSGHTVVPYALRQGSDDRDPILPERADNGRRATRRGIPDEAELGDPSCGQADLVAHEADRERADCGAEFRVHLGKRLADDNEPCRGRDAAAPDELDGQAAPGHLLGDLRAGAVDDADLVAQGQELADVSRRLVRDGAANFEDDGQDVYSALMRT